MIGVLNHNMPVELRFHALQADGVPEVRFERVAVG